MRTLADINAAEKPPQDWLQTFYRFTRTYAVGKQGRRGTGTKLHLLTIDTVTGLGPEGEEAKAKGRRIYGPGDVWSIEGVCNRNSGSISGRVVYGKDTKDITCERCLEAYGGLLADKTEE